MPTSKIQNHQEVERWFEEGRTYSWMIEEYRKRYNMETTIGMWGNYRKRHGLELRVERTPELVPWRVEEQHRWAYPLQMLRAEGRLRRGQALRPSEAQRLASFKRKLKEMDVVVHYDPSTEEGFFLVPRRDGVDVDMVRQPDRITSKRWSTD